MTNPREQIAAALGKPFTTREQVAKCLGKNSHSLDEYLRGCTKVGPDSYYTYDVVDNILKIGVYE